MVAGVTRGRFRTYQGEEKSARDLKLKTRMEKLCRQRVLKAMGPGLPRIGSNAPKFKPAPTAQVEEREEVGSFGD